LLPAPDVVGAQPKSMGDAHARAPREPVLLLKLQVWSGERIGDLILDAGADGLLRHACALQYFEGMVVILGCRPPPGRFARSSPAKRSSGSFSRKAAGLGL
jgi:hypothetical protein